MANLAIPFCYDKFTTNYFLPDNSYGTVVGGAYTGSNGDIANLETGDYTLANGKTGNIYSNDLSKKPNTAALPIPSQYTASGVGPAIPASGLGDAVTKTFVTTPPGSTIVTTVTTTEIGSAAAVSVSSSSSSASASAVTTTAKKNAAARSDRKSDWFILLGSLIASLMMFL
jgi:hypothetical protein